MINGSEHELHGRVPASDLNPCPYTVTNPACQHTREGALPVFLCGVLTCWVGDGVQTGVETAHLLPLAVYTRHSNLKSDKPAQCQ